MMNGVDRIESLFYVCILHYSRMKIFVATGIEMHLSLNVTVKNTLDKILQGRTTYQSCSNTTSFIYVESEHILY